MSRFSSWLLAVLGTAFAAAGASACPGSMAIGLPLLFGTDQPTSPFPMKNDLPSIFASKPPHGLDEVAEFGEGLDRKGMAQECLKVWRQLVRDGRFDLAPTVAAKAASFDPTNIDVQHAVIVSQVLRGIDEQSRRDAKAAAATELIKVAPESAAAGCEADVCPACPEQKSGSNPANVTASQPPRTFRLAIPLPFISGPNLPGSGLAVKYLIDAASPKAPLPPLPKVEAPRAEVRPISPPTENEMVAEQALKHLFPGGLLARDDVNQSRNVSSNNPTPSKQTAELLEREFKNLEREINHAFPDSDVQVRLVGDKVVIAGQAYDSIDATHIIRLIRANAPGADVSPQISDTPPHTIPGETVFEYGQIPSTQFVNMLRIAGKDSNPNAPIASSSNSATPQCGSIVLGVGMNSDAGLQGSIRTVGHAIPADANKRVTIKTTAWQVECDRVVSMNEREMILDGNVSLTMRQRDVSVQASRVRVNMTDGSIQVDGK